MAPGVVVTTRAALQTTTSVDEMRAAPLGRALVGDRFVYAQPAPALFCTALWGRPETSALAALLRALPLELAPTVAPHVSVFDASRLASVDADAFAALAAYVSSERARLARQVTRLCIVRPEGISGAVVAGFFAVVDAPYPVHVTATLAEAPALLGKDAPADALRDFDALVAAIAERPFIVARVAAVCVERGLGADVADVAAAIAMSVRTLQRRLAEAGTTFVDVQRGARLDAAAQKLVQTDAPLTVIAMECGFSTSQHFAAEWKAAHGATPTAWRKARRR